MALDFNDVSSAFKSALKGERVLHSNESLWGKALGGILDNGLGAGEMTYRVLKNNEGVKEAAIKTFAKNGEKVLANGEKMQLNYGKIAGSYIGVSAAARIATGGGLYKDKNGNGNLIGVPFI